MLLIAAHTLAKSLGCFLVPGFVPSEFLRTILLLITILIAI